MFFSCHLVIFFFKHSFFLCPIKFKYCKVLMIAISSLKHLVKIVWADSSGGAINNDNEI